MEKNTEFTTSVAMCTYNGAKYLESQLRTILNQTIPPDEIIVCDDCSKDNSVSICRNILSRWDGKWEVVRNEQNLGFKKNFEKAISLCHGDIIFLSDQDDVWNTKKLEKMLPVFHDPNVVLAFHDATLVNENLEQLYPSFWRTLGFNPSDFSKGDYRIVFAHNVMQGAACCFRRKLFEIAAPFPLEAIHDEWLLLVGLSIGKVIPVSQTLLQYRQAQNAIGGMPLTIPDKIRKWWKTFNKGFDSHREYLKSRSQIFTLLVERNREQGNYNQFSANIVKFNEFLSTRIRKINDRVDRLNKSKFNQWYFPFEAKKQWLKDWIYFLANLNSKNKGVSR